MARQSRAQPVRRYEETQDIDGALAALVQAMQGVEGLISLYVQYSMAPAFVIALVESEQARLEVRAVEDQLFDAQPFLPIDLHVDDLLEDSERYSPPEQNGFVRLWARTPVAG